MKDNGFRLDYDANLATNDPSDLDIRDGYIAYKLYPAGDMSSEAELQSDLVIACRVQQQLVNKGRWGRNNSASMRS
jgi:hypothetical protein